VCLTGCDGQLASGVVSVDHLTGIRLLHALGEKCGEHPVGQLSSGCLQLKQRKQGGQQQSKLAPWTGSASSSAGGQPRSARVSTCTARMLDETGSCRGIASF
jgi:hypothetical protein